MVEPLIHAEPAPEPRTYTVEPHPAGGYTLVETPGGLDLPAAFRKACDLAGWSRP